jgi:hypothetical protein
MRKSHSYVDSEYVLTSMCIWKVCHFESLKGFQATGFLNSVELTASLCGFFTIHRSKNKLKNLYWYNLLAHCIWVRHPNASNGGPLRGAFLVVQGV